MLFFPRHFTIQVGNSYNYILFFYFRTHDVMSGDFRKLTTAKHERHKKARENMIKMGKEGNNNVGTKTRCGLALLT